MLRICGASLVMGGQVVPTRSWMHWFKIFYFFISTDFVLMHISNFVITPLFLINQVEVLEGMWQPLKLASLGLKLLGKYKDSYFQQT